MTYQDYNFGDRGYPNKIVFKTLKNTEQIEQIVKNISNTQYSLLLGESPLSTASKLKGEICLFGYYYIRY